MDNPLRLVAVAGLPACLGIYGSRSYVRGGVSCLALRAEQPPTQPEQNANLANELQGIHMPLLSGNNRRVSQKSI